jgi:hypothetical protein
MSFDSNDVYISTVLQFITEATKVGMPTRFLSRVLDKYRFISSSDSGKHETSRFWEEITLDRSMWADLQRPGLMGKFDAVSTLYHEATHAYIDLEGYGETQEFEEAMEYYNMAELADGNHIWNKDMRVRAVEEAAADYVGHRAKTLWRAWTRLESLADLLIKVSAGKMTVDKGRELILSGAAIDEATKSKLSVPAEYNIDMQERVFGYVMVGDGTWKAPIHPDVQRKIVSKPIPDKLREHCDKVILEDKIYDDFNSMLRLRINFETLYKSMTQFSPMAEAMLRGSTAWVRTGPVEEARWVWQRFATGKDPD